MTVLGMVVIVTWAWMLAASLHVEDLRRKPRRHPTSVDGAGTPAG